MLGVSSANNDRGYVIDNYHDGSTIINNREMVLGKYSIAPEPFDLCFFGLA
jgi:hypothetical protein